jgi:hypothetical protein
MSHRRWIAAAGFVLATLAACADADRVVFLALVGEAPGDKPLYTGFGPSARFGRPYPRIPEPGYRPPVLPDAAAGTAGAGAAGEAAVAARQALSDRASDYELRARYLRVNGEEYMAAAGPLRPSVGQPLPRLSGTTQARLTAARAALARIQGDVLSIHGILQRTDRAKASAERALAAVKAGGKAAEPLVKPLGDGITGIDRMLKDGDALVGAFVEWMAEQRSALDGLEDEIRRGIATGPAILQRESIIQ